MIPSPLGIRREGGEALILQPASPAAGSQWISTVPPHEIWLPIALNFDFSTSAAVANRVPLLDFKNATGALSWRGLMVNCTQTASKVGQYFFAQNLPAVDVLKVFGTFNFGYMLIPIIYLDPGGVIKTTIQNIQAGDQISNINIMLIRYNI